MRVLSHCVCGLLSPFSCVWLCNPIDYSPPGSSVHGDSLSKNTRVGRHALLQGIFPTQGSNPLLLCLLHWQAGPLLLTPPGKGTESPRKAFSHFMIPYVCLWNEPWDQGHNSQVSMKNNKHGIISREVDPGYTESNGLGALPREQTRV